MQVVTAAAAQLGVFKPACAGRRGVEAGGAGVGADQRGGNAGSVQPVRAIRFAHGVCRVHALGGAPGFSARRPSPGRPVARSCPDWGTARLPARGLGKGLAATPLPWVPAPGAASANGETPIVTAGVARARIAARSGHWASVLPLRKQTTRADNDLTLTHAVPTELCGASLSARTIPRA